MNINGVLGQFNIARSANVQQANFNGNVTVIKPDMFQKGSYVTVPRKVSSNNTLDLSKFYSPKQLLQAYSNPSFINSLIEKNPKITALLDSKGIEATVSPENVLGIINTHLTTTTAFALQIANKMGLSAADKKTLEQACVFHDFGKILIPKEVLNKPGKLNEEEKEIMDMHAELGAELLSTAGMNQRIVNLVGNHHNSQAGNTDMLCDILSVADIYSALREDRVYKNAMSEKDAIALLDQKAKAGEVSTEVVNALKASLLSAKSA